MVSRGQKLGLCPYVGSLANMSGTWDLGPHVNRPLIGHLSLSGIKTHS